MVDIPMGEGTWEGECYTQIKINNPPRILQLFGPVCLIKNTCGKSSKFFVFNSIEYGTSLVLNVCPKLLKCQSKHASMPINVIIIQPQQKTDGTASYARYTVKGL